MAKTTWRIDKNTCKWMLENVPKMQNGEKFPMTTCPKCGADYHIDLAHCCGKYIDFEVESRETE